MLAVGPAPPESNGFRKSDKDAVVIDPLHDDWNEPRALADRRAGDHELFCATPDKRPPKGSNDRESDIGRQNVPDALASNVIYIEIKTPREIGVHFDDARVSTHEAKNARRFAPKDMSLRLGVDRDRRACVRRTGVFRISGARVHESSAQLV